MQEEKKEDKEEDKEEECNSSGRETTTTAATAALSFQHLAPAECSSRSARGVRTGEIKGGRRIVTRTVSHLLPKELSRTSMKWQR